MGIYGESIDTRSATFARLTDDRQILIQWVQLCLSTTTGTLWSAPLFGKNLRDYVAAGLAPDMLAAIPGEVEAALELDRRIASADVTVIQTYTAIGQVALTLDPIIIIPRDSGHFELTALATRDLVSVILRGI